MDETRIACERWIWPIARLGEVDWEAHFHLDRLEECTHLLITLHRKANEKRHAHHTLPPDAPKLFKLSTTSLNSE